LAVAFEHSSVSRDDFRRLHTTKPKPLGGPQLEQACAATRRAALDALAEQFPDADPDVLMDAVDAELHAPEPPLFQSQRVLLGQLVREGLPPLQFLDSPSLGADLFYEQMLFIVSGHKKSGKSLALFATALDRVRAGKPSVYLDLENGKRVFARRLERFSADPAAVDEHFHYLPFVRGLTLDNLYAELEGVAQRTPGAFLIVDSLRGLIARLSPSNDPLKVNDPQSIERVCQPFMEASKQLGLTVCIIDHPTKVGDDTGEYSTANSGAKEAAVDAVYFWTKVQPFSADVAGAVTLKVTSDREGAVNLGSDFKRAWKVGGQGAGNPITFEPTSPKELDGKVARIEDDLGQFLKDHPGEQFSLTQLRKSVKGTNTEIDAAVQRLCDPARTPRDPIHAVIDGSYTRYAWDESIQDSAVLPV
jgi:hypothetical protein